MTLSRRHFVGGSAAFSLLSVALGETDLAHALGDTGESVTRPSFGQEYWSSLYQSQGSTRGLSHHMTPADRVSAIYFSDPNDNTAAIRQSSSIKDSELPDFSDEAVVTMELTGFRPGSVDHEALAQVNFANMHLSCQRISGSQFIGPIAWAAIASVFSSRAKNLPAVTALDWSVLSGQGSPNTANTATAANSNPRIQHVLLSHGAGKLSVNVTTTPKKSALDKILTVCINSSKVVSPLFGFPAISTLALGAFYDFYGKVETAEKSNFLLSTPQRDIVVAKQGLKVADIDVHPLHLVSGDYILVPQIHQEDFESKMEKLSLVNGYVVERSSEGAVADRVKNAIPGISYLVLSAKVQPASEVPITIGITDPVLEDNPVPATASGPAKTGSGKKKP